MITSVGGEYNWLPEKLGSLFVDKNDLYGLEYWYNKVVQTEKRILASAQTQ